MNVLALFVAGFFARLFSELVMDQVRLRRAKAQALAVEQALQNIRDQLNNHSAVRN